MDSQELEWKAEVARRLKAARWLAGDVEPSDKGKSGYAVRALSTTALAARSPLPENRITSSTLGRIERMERRATPMELTAIGGALNMPSGYFSPARPIVVIATDQDQPTNGTRQGPPQDLPGTSGLGLSS